MAPTPPTPDPYNDQTRPLIGAPPETQQDPQSSKVHLIGITADDHSHPKTPPFSWKKLWRFTGPGLLMSIAFLDPGNLEADLQAGATAGYSLLWLLMWATAMALLIQLLSARLGVATGRHLAELCREEYPGWARLLLWLMAEMALIGADIQEVIGSAIAIKILSLGALPLWSGVLITAADCFIFLLLENYGVRKLEAFFAILIATMALSFAWMFGEAKPSGTELLAGLALPKLSSKTIQQAAGLVGGIIMPHNVFLHSALVRSREIDRSSRAQVQEALNYNTIESTLALIISFSINLFVTAVFAKSFYGTTTAESVGLSNAGYYLQEKYGDDVIPVLYIWAVGLLAAGVSSTITGTYAGQFIMSGFLDIRVEKWKRAVITRSCAIVPTIVVAVVFDSSEDTLDVLNEWINVLQSIQIPFAVIPLLCLVSKEEIMGVFKIGLAAKPHPTSSMGNLNPNLLLWLMAELALIGADIQEVIGSAIAIKILSLGALPLWSGVLITAADCFIFLLLENYGVRKLEAFFAILIATMALSFAWMFGEAKPSGVELLAGLALPKLSSKTIQQAAGLVGGIIMPHNIFLHSALVQSREIDRSNRAQVQEALNYNTIESTLALIISFSINLFVTAVFAKSFYGTTTAESVGLSNAGYYLQEKYGDDVIPVLYIWAVGLLAAGVSSTITGTYAGQFIMSGFLDIRVEKWKRAVITRSCAIVPTIVVAVVFDSSEDMLDVLNEWINVLQSIQIPFAVIPLLCLVSKEEIMGVFKIGLVTKVASWLVAGLVTVINGYLLLDFFSSRVTGASWLMTLACILTAGYVSFVLYLVSRNSALPCRLRLCI